MKEINPTYKMAAQVCWMHFIRCNRWTALLVGGIYLVVWLFAKLLGKSFDQYTLLHYPHIAFFIVWIIYLLPVNLWVTRGLLRQHFKKFRITVIEDESQ